MTPKRKPCRSHGRRFKNRSISEKRPRPMTCQDLAAQTRRLRPGADPRAAARLCLLLATFVDDVDTLDDEDRLQKAWQDMSIRLQAATDQHPAMTEELESLAGSSSQEFTAE